MSNKLSVLSTILVQLNGEQIAELKYKTTKQAEKAYQSLLIEGYFCPNKLKLIENCNFILL